MNSTNRGNRPPSFGNAPSSLGGSNQQPPFARSNSNNSNGRIPNTPPPNRGNGNRREGFPPPRGQNPPGQTPPPHRPGSMPPTQRQQQGQQGQGQRPPQRPQQRPPHEGRIPENRSPRPPMPSQPPQMIAPQQNGYYDNYDNQDDYVDDSYQAFPDLARAEKENDDYATPNSYDNSDDFDYELGETKEHIEEVKRRAEKNFKKKPKDEFIDEENLKLEPFGGKKVRVSEFDKRENVTRNAKMVRTGVFILLGALVALGVKNAILPPATMKPAEVAEIVDIKTNQVGFPLRRGAAFGEAYVNAFLTIGSDNADKALEFFYTGRISKNEVSNDGGDNNRYVFGNVKQKVVSGPYLIYQFANTPQSAMFKYNALVNTVSQIPGSNDESVKNESNKTFWVTVSVQVFYDSDNDTFGIVPNSETYVPSMARVGKVPGNKEDANSKNDTDLAKRITPTLTEFFKGYAEASITNHTAINQYMVPDAKTDELNGLNGIVKLNGSIDVKAWSGDDGKVYTKVKVPWVSIFNVNTRESDTDTDEETISREAKVGQTSTYSVVLRKVSGKYLVEKVSPFDYTPKDKTENDFGDKEADLAPAGKDEETKEDNTETEER